MVFDAVLPIHTAAKSGSPISVRRVAGNKVAADRSLSFRSISLTQSGGLGAGLATNLNPARYTAACEGQEGRRRQV